VRGSHRAEDAAPAQTDAYTMQDQRSVVFVIPWLDERFLVVGTPTCRIRRSRRGALFDRADLSPRGL
jgi:hypothetical protein